MVISLILSLRCVLLSIISVVKSNIAAFKIFPLSSYFLLFGYIMPKCDFILVVTVCSIFHHSWKILFFFLLWLQPWHMKVSRPGIESQQQLQPTAELLTHCARPGIEPKPLRRPKLLVVRFLTYCTIAGTPVYSLLTLLL